MGKECVVLIPGFFGFGAFGPAKPAAGTITRQPVSYFSNVVPILTEVLGGRLAPGGIVAHEPPPTGSIESRVRRLAETLLRVIGDQALRGVRDPVIHLVGHSTGGVDARLLTNRAYERTGLDPAVRETLLQRVGTVVTLAAPLHGTPIAESRLMPFQRLVDVLWLWSILEHAGQWVGGFPVTAALAISAPISHLVEKLFPGTVVELFLRQIANLDSETARQIRQFRARILEDTRLIRDLAPARMSAMEATLSGGDHPRLVHVVTASPRPRLDGIEGLDRRVIYWICYSGAADDRFTSKANPDPAFWAAHPELDPVPAANDGVVPSSSQFRAGTTPLSVVLADHMDVVGHFHGKSNTTLFRSGSNFTPEQHDAMWRRIAGAL
jgi:triacylglycerol lipase